MKETKMKKRRKIKRRHKTLQKSLNLRAIAEFNLKMCTVSLECENCGACCHRDQFVELTTEDIEREPRLKEIMIPMRDVPQSVKINRNKYPYVFRTHQGCPFLSYNKKCLIHNNKPEACKNYIPSLVTCRMARAGMSINMLMQCANQLDSKYDFIRAIMQIDPRKLQKLNNSNTKIGTPISSQSIIFSKEDMIIDIVSCMKRIKKNADNANMNIVQFINNTNSGF
uniref:Putative zinc-or iron-chelating protein n=1 Tax=viral metagenome TaxID=1070528 RepID=A0A6M3J8S0_9ZZZZ